MSFEGYYQCLCEKGHYSELDVYDPAANDTYVCPICNSPVAWHNQVDTTNGSFYYDEAGNQKERIDGFVELEVDQPPEICTCHCGHVHAKTACTYKIPSLGIGHHSKIPGFNWEF